MATTTSENINDAETLPELDVIWKIVSPGELDVNVNVTSCGSPPQQNTDW